MKMNTNILNKNNFDLSFQSTIGKLIKHDKSTFISYKSTTHQFMAQQTKDKPKMENDQRVWYHEKTKQYGYILGVSSLGGMSKATFCHVDDGTVEKVFTQSLTPTKMYYEDKIIESENKIKKLENSLTKSVLIDHNLQFPLYSASFPNKQIVDPRPHLRPSAYVLNFALQDSSSDAISDPNLETVASLRYCIAGFGIKVAESYLWPIIDSGATCE